MNLMNSNTIITMTPTTIIRDHLKMSSPASTHQTRIRIIATMRMTNVRIPMINTTTMDTAHVLLRPDLHGTLGVEDPAKALPAV